MKHVRKIMGMLLALIMVFSISGTVMAAPEGSLTDGSITINIAMEGHTYSVYQIFYLESYDASKGAYAYQPNSAWESWLKTQTQYVSIDAQGYVTWVEGADAASFAKAALTYVKTNSIAADAVKTADGTVVEFTGLNLGYYLVDTTLGTLCSLDTTTPDVTMREKNEVPSQEKEVQEDSDSSWGEENTAQIGDTVNFRTMIHVKPGAESYVLHDDMSEGLTLDPDSIQVEGLTRDTDYTVSASGLTDGCDFEVAFGQDYLDTVTENTDLVVTYQAVLNEKAQIFEDSNTNKTWLDYGDKTNTNSTPPSETKTYTFRVDIVKTDEEDKVLDGAEFKLYDAKTGGNEISVVQISDGVYRLAKDNEQGAEKITTVNGQVEIRGFDANTSYYLEETKAPDGYNRLAERVEIAVKEANLDATVSQDAWVSGGVHVVNKTGDLLPSTGGMGTTLFYVIGIALAAGAAVLLIARKRADSKK